jgi:hypothetical protein
MTKWGCHQFCPCYVEQCQVNYAPWKSRLDWERER